MRTVQIYVENRRLELFSDEKIVVNSSIQNIEDLSGVLTDFSQTFSVPCTPINNYIFEHYYNNDVDPTIDQRLRRDARIEIDHIPFRNGKVQMELGQIKEGMPNNYQVTFFGDVVTLKDLMGEDKLIDLDYSSLDHTYSGAEIQSRIETDPSTTDYDVRYPLISSDRVWQYGDGSSNDISVSGTAIDYTELFPAVRVKSIFDLIETKYGVTFTGSFLDTKRFTNLFMWFKNKDTYTYTTPQKAIRFGIGDLPPDPVRESEVFIEYIPPYTLLTGSYTDAVNIKHNLRVEISTASSIDYYLDVYQNGILVSSLLGNGTQTFNVVNNALNYFSLDYVYFFRLRSVSSATFSATITYDINYTLVQWSGAAIIASANFTDTYSDTTAASFTTDADTDLQSLCPDMKVVDFFKGILNVFNMTCYATDLTTYKIEPLDNWYNNGIEWNITEYLNSDEITYARPSLYKKINFEWEQSMSFMNREFYDLFKREYGSLNAMFDFDGGEYTIKVPFETQLPTKFTGTNLQVAYSLGTDPEYKAYIPKPTLMYMYEQQTSLVDFYFHDGSTANLISEYMPFGQDVYFNQNENTLNFGSEISSFTLDVEDLSLYRNYYEAYMLNLYNPKTRLVTCKCNLPLSILTNINLNDQVIIRDKKYIINEMSSDLTSGDVQFTLLSNWRDSFDYSYSITVDNTNSTVQVNYSVPEDTTVTIGSSFESNFVTISDTTPTGEQVITLTILQNLSGVQRTNTFPVTVVNRGVTLPTQFIVVIQEA